MSFGRLRNEKQQEALRSIVAQKRVWDLGAGLCDLSVLLCQYGALSVVAVDTKFPEDSLHLLDYPIEWQQRSFEELGSPEMSVAFLSWPINRELGWDRLLANANVIVYLGKCTDGSYCGSQVLWETLRRRSLLRVVPDRCNDLLIYGRKLESPREGEDLCGEEYAALHTHRVFSWHEAQNLGSL